MRDSARRIVVIVAAATASVAFQPAFAQTKCTGSTCGVVQAVQQVQQKGSGSGVGMVAGGVIGGVLGHQIGSGRGNTVATIAGAIGGAVVGNQVERANERDRYRVIVRLDSGATVAMNEVGEGEMHVGDRVRIVDRRVYRY